jgi:hypothetical protein
MTISDKSAVNRPEYTEPRQGARAVSSNELTNKSVPRTRKEKCQKTPCRGQIELLQIEGHGSVLAFCCTFAPVSIAHLFRDRHCRLTLLTKACQKRQNFRRTRLIDVTLLSRLTFLTPACQICQTVERRHHGCYKPYDTTPPSRPYPAIVPSTWRIPSWKPFVVKWSFGAPAALVVTRRGYHGCGFPAAATRPSRLKSPTSACQNCQTALGDESRTTRERRSVQSCRGPPGPIA